MSFLHLQRLVLNVPDPEAAAAWYRHHLGFQDSESACPDGRAVCLATPGKVVLLELWAEAGAGCARQDFRRRFRQQLVLAVDNPLREADRLRAAGARRLTDAPGPLVLRDPFGLETVLAPHEVISAA